jgi:hypothetical protein
MHYNFNNLIFINGYSFLIVILTLFLDFGIRIDSQNKIEQMANHSITTILTPFKFKPMMTRTLP